MADLGISRSPTSPLVFGVRPDELMVTCDAQIDRIITGRSLAPVNPPVAVEAGKMYRIGVDAKTGQGIVELAE